MRTATNRDIPMLKGTIRAMADESIDSVGEFPRAGRRFNEEVAAMAQRVSDLEARVAQLGEVGAERSTKAGKYAAVLRFAANKQTANGKVAVSPAEIKGCTGVSRRYAYNLLKAMAEDMDGVAVREATQVETGSGSARKSN